MKLTTLQDRREQRDMITMYKLVNDIEMVDRQDLVPRANPKGVQTRGHTTKIKKKLQFVFMFCSVNLK